MNRRLRHNEKGMTYLEMLAVFAVLATLSTIALSTFLKYREASYAAVLKMQLSTAYRIANIYFSDQPNGFVTVNNLRALGFRDKSEVNLTVEDGHQESLRIKGTHLSVTGVYEVDQNGRIRKL